jgi:hypothetical protein
LSAVNKVVWIDPAIITQRVAPINDLHGIVGGDWDLERLYPLNETVKYRAIREHFIDGVPWEETELFRDIYTRRLKTNHVRGAWTFEELVKQYNTRVDGMAESLKREGFQTQRNGKAYPLPGFYIGRTGELFIGNQGNHRLAIAQVLGLGKVAGKIICRHPMA